MTPTAGTRALAAVLGLLLGLVAAVALGARVPARATSTPAPPKLSMSDLYVENGVLHFVLGTGGFSGAGVDPARVGVRINGSSVQPELLAAETSGARRAAVLAIDVSLSMEEVLSRGTTRIAAAQDAARSFLATVPDDVEVGLVTFAGDVQVVVEPTTDHDAVADAVGRLELAEDTALYAGVQRAVEVAGDDGTRSVLVLSDGENANAPGTLEETTRRILESGVSVDTVGLGEQQGSAELTAMAAAGGGQAVGTDRAGDLASRFMKAAEALGAQLAVSAVVPERYYGRTVTIETEAYVGDVRVVDRASYPIEAAPLADAAPPIAVQVQPAVGSWAAVLAIVGVGLGVGGLLFAAAITLTKQHTRRARLARLIRGGRSPEPTETAPERDHGLRQDAVALTDRLLRRRDLDQTLGARLVAAGVPVRPAEWVLLHAAAAVGLALLLLLATGGNLAAAVVGLFAGGIVPWVYVLSRARARHDAFAAALPETLQTMSASLSAGLTLQQAVESVARDGRAPVSDEVRRALVEVRLGMPLEDALDRVAARMASADFAWVVTATRIQREVGGNLPELLDLVASTLRDRERLRRQARVLSAEGRISAWVVGLLPIAFACYMLVVRPGYLEPLVTDPFGWAMLLGGSTLFVLGAVWLARLSRLKV